MRLSGLMFAGALTITALAAGAARADTIPPEDFSATSPASADTVCRGPAARPGQTLHGPVLRVIGADTLCVALAPDPSTWVPVTLARPASDRRLLMAAAFAKNATCEIGADGLAVCDIEGQKLADLVRQPGIVEASLEWR